MNTKEWFREGSSDKSWREAGWDIRSDYKSEEKPAFYVESPPSSLDAARIDGDED